MSNRTKIQTVEIHNIVNGEKTGDVFKGFCIWDDYGMANEAGNFEV